MPVSIVEIPETVESIARPVVYSVVDELVNWLRLKSRPPVIFLGGGTQPPTPKGFGVETTRYNIFNSEARIFIEVVEDFPDYGAASAIQQRPDTILEFHDPALGVHLKPVYQPIHVTVNFKIRTNDETSADQIRKTWKRLVAAGKDVYHHTVTYHYPIPLEQMAILLEIHKAREATAGYGEDIGVYLRKYFSPKMTVISDQAANNPLFAIRENQTGIQGWYDFTSEPPKFDKDADGGSWVTNVSYQFYYERVESVEMRYPIMVHNSILPKHLYNTDKPAELNDVRGYHNNSGRLFEHFEGMNKPTAWRGEPGLSIPHYDDWIQETKYPNTQCLTRILLSVDPDNRNIVLNLNDLGEWAFDAGLLRHIKAMGAGIFTPGQALVHVTVCEGQRIMDFDWMSITPNLDIFCSQDFNLRKVYHLNMALNYNLPSLSERALRDLKLNGGLLRKVILMIDPDIESRGFSLRLLPDGSMASATAITAINESYQRAWQSLPTDVGSRRFVGEFIINAHGES